MNLDCIILLPVKGARTYNLDLDINNQLQRFQNSEDYIHQAPSISIRRFKLIRALLLLIHSSSVESFVSETSQSLIPRESLEIQIVGLWTRNASFSQSVAAPSPRFPYAELGVVPQTVATVPMYFLTRFQAVMFPPSTPYIYSPFPSVSCQRSLRSSTPLYLMLNLLSPKAAQQVVRGR